jgi:hypothetical protein
MIHELLYMYESGMMRTRRRRVSVVLMTGLVALVLASLNWGIVSARPACPNGGGQEREIPMVLWAAEQSIDTLPQPAPVPASQKVTARGALNAAAAIWLNSSGAVSRNRQDSLHFITSSNIILRLEGHQVCQYLDIPPPSIRLYL